MCAPLPDLLDWLEGVPADLDAWRASFDARLRDAFAHRRSLYGLATELEAQAQLHVPPELRDLACTCLRAVARVNAHDGLSFALLCAVRDAVMTARR